MATVTDKTGELHEHAIAGEGRIEFSARDHARAFSVIVLYMGDAADDGQEKFVRDFAAAWAKVMELDRFDLRR